MTVLDRLVAAGISEETAHEELAAGMVHVDGEQVTSPDAPVLAALAPRVARFGVDTSRPALNNTLYALASLPVTVVPAHS